MKVTRRIVVRGMVQGVGYRFFCRREAEAMGITGFVKNLLNGNVEVVVEGEVEIIDHFITVLKKGPHLSEVTEVLITDLRYENKYKKFAIEF